MSDTENDAPATNANGKHVNALELGPRKKAYILCNLPLLHHTHQLLLAPKEIRLYIMASTSATPNM